MFLGFLDFPPVARVTGTHPLVFNPRDMLSWVPRLPCLRHLSLGRALYIAGGRTSLSVGQHRLLHSLVASRVLGLPSVQDFASDRQVAHVHHTLAECSSPRRWSSLISDVCPSPPVGTPTSALRQSFSRRAGMLAVATAEVADKGAANIFVKR